MAIMLNQCTRLTTEAEKLLVELGGGKTDKTLNKSELSNALGNAINELAEHGSFSILEKIYRAATSRDPELTRLSTLDTSTSKLQKLTEAD